MSDWLFDLGNSRFKFAPLDGAVAGTLGHLCAGQPLGVAALVTPWNFPCAMITRKAAAGGTGVATGACLLLSAGRIGTVRSASVTSVPGAGASACAETGACSPCATR